MEMNSINGKQRPPQIPPTPTPRVEDIFKDGEGWKPMFGTSQFF